MGLGCCPHRTALAPGTAGCRAADLRKGFCLGLVPAEGCGKDALQLEVEHFSPQHLCEWINAEVGHRGRAVLCWLLAPDLSFESMSPQSQWPRGFAFPHSSLSRAHPFLTSEEQCWLEEELHGRRMRAHLRAASPCIPHFAVP